MHFLCLNKNPSSSYCDQIQKLSVLCFWDLLKISTLIIFIKHQNVTKMNGVPVIHHEKPKIKKGYVPANFFLRLGRYQNTLQTWSYKELVLDAIDIVFNFVISNV